MKYNIGDKVVVRTDLEVADWPNAKHKPVTEYQGFSFEPEMAKLADQEVTIHDILRDTWDPPRFYYEIEEDDCKYGWPEEMFEDKEAK